MEMNEKIKSLRLQKGLTLEQVGNYVGVGKSTVRKWENGMIENMRRDKIAKLAAVLGTTPDYLMGWGVKQDDWSSAFCLSLEQELAIIDPADAEATHIDIERLSSIANGDIPVSLAEACTIADELGTSLDHMVGLRPLSGKAVEFIDLFAQLSTDQQKMLIAQMKGLLFEKDKENLK